MKTWKIAGINFDHMHMGDLLRGVVNHPNAEVVGVSDESRERMGHTIETLKIPQDRVFTDYRACIEKTKPDLIILCPSSATHADWTEKVAPFGTHVLVEKPFAANLEQADRMIAALKATGKQLIINWPLRWYPCHVTAKRLIDEGLIGALEEVHYYDGNRGPLSHIADKIETKETAEAKATSWWYKKAAGGGSLLDYLGYGVTLGTWFHNGRKPIEVTTVTGGTPGLEVDEHSISVARYECGLSRYETRWGTFSDPWTHQPQPKCGFVLKGREGTISTYDYEKTIRVQTRAKPEGYDLPVDALKSPNDAVMPYVLDRLEKNLPVEGPLSPELCRIGQQIVDTAMKSATEKRTVPLVDRPR
jgi:glucose-fructose oxidoreductase